MTASITIAHLSDVHLGPLTGFTPRYWSAKRLFGFYNWHRNRSGLHDPAVIERLLADIATQQVDHVVVTGDLVNIGLPVEHIRALDWLRRVGPPERVSVIPGNHDIYTEMGDDPGAMRWHPYMRCDVTARNVRDVSAFPYVRRLGRVALIGVNSAIPTKPGVAIGRVGDQQRTRLARLLDDLGREGVFRIVLIHHPPLPGHSNGRHHELTDAAAVEELLMAHGAELVLHGHNHTNTVVWRTPRIGPAIPIVGIASGSAARVHRGAPLARYHVYRVTPGAGTPIHLSARGLAEPHGPVVTLESRALTPSAETQAVAGR